MKKTEHLWGIQCYADMMHRMGKYIFLHPEGSGGNLKEIIREKPEGTNYDFRDPKAIKIGEKYYIVLGACVDEKGTFLLYESEDAENWKYRCPLITEETKIRTIECPDFFPLGDKHVLVCSPQNKKAEKDELEATAMQRRAFSMKTAGS